MEDEESGVKTLESKELKTQHRKALNPKEVDVGKYSVVIGDWEGIGTKEIPSKPHLIIADELRIYKPLIKKTISPVTILKDVRVLVCHGKRTSEGVLTTRDGKSISEIVNALRKGGHEVDALGICNETSAENQSNDISEIKPPVIHCDKTKLGVSSRIEDGKLVVLLIPDRGGSIVYESFLDK